MFKLAEDTFFRNRKNDVNYANYLLKHKLGVAEAGVKLNLPASVLIKHDWSKFKPDTWTAHRNYFYGSDGINGENTKQVFLDYQASRKQHFMDEPSHHGMNKSMNQELESVADWYSVNKTNARLSGLNFPDFKLWWFSKRAKFVHQLRPETVLTIDDLVARDISFTEYLTK